jgi:hypothetical protein
LPRRTDVAKKKAASDSSAVVTIEFPRTGNPWIDAGIVGLYRVLEAKAAYADPAAESFEADPGSSDCSQDVELKADRLILRGTSSGIGSALERAYDRLIKTYYDVSSMKQREVKEGFYYESNHDRFVAFAKKRAIGAALLLFDKAGRVSPEEEGTAARVAWATALDAKGKPHEASRRFASTSCLPSGEDGPIPEQRELEGRSTLGPPP